MWASHLFPLDPSDPNCEGGKVLHTLGGQQTLTFMFPPTEGGGVLQWGEPMPGARLQGQRWQKPLLRIQISVPLPEMNLYFLPILKVGGWANYGVIWPFHQTNYPCQEHHSMANRPKWEQIPGKDPMSCPPVLPSALTAALDWFTQITDPCPSMGRPKQALVL